MCGMAREVADFASGQYRVIGVASCVTALLLFGFAKWMNADPVSVQYFLQFACVLASLLLWGLFMECGFCEFLRIWRWHRRTALRK